MCVPHGSLIRVYSKAVNKPGQCDRELGGHWPRWPLSSERGDRAMQRERQKQQSLRKHSRGSINITLTLHPGTSSSHLRPLFATPPVPFVGLWCPGLIWPQWEKQQSQDGPKRWRRKHFSVKKTKKREDLMAPQEAKQSAADISKGTRTAKQCPASLFLNTQSFKKSSWINTCCRSKHKLKEKPFRKRSELKISKTF